MNRKTTKTRSDNVVAALVVGRVAVVVDVILVPQYVSQKPAHEAETVCLDKVLRQLAFGATRRCGRRFPKNCNG